jgi:type IV secretion system protein VirB9
VKQLLDAGSPTNNRRYSVQGSGELAPVEAWDDGRTMFLRFGARSRIPAIYDGAGDEIKNINVDNDIVQVHGVRDKLVLRSGRREVACVFNDAFDPNAARSPTNTSSPSVKRTLKGSGT